MEISKQYNMDYPKKLYLRMRTLWYICVSTVCVKRGFLMERTFFVSDVPESMLESHKGGCLPFLGW